MSENLSGNTPLSDAIKVVKDGMAKGIMCPCCGQYARLYERSLTGATAASLIRLSKLPLGGYHHFSKFVGVTAGDYSKARYWGLMIEKPNEADSTKKHSGLWCLTERGLNFVRRAIEIPRKIKLYDGVFYGYVDEDDLVNIEDCLGTRFNYQELMTGR